MIPAFVVMAAVPIALMIYVLNVEVRQEGFRTTVRRIVR